ncbi:protein trichome birefringence-like 39 [Amaranthus tricolor]|uniref:protein trichome birefringence-like 39 n=1 Tax=Amaranthus tricolor TaxID=29722 RepID=UPI00258DFD51|nr:protein trichome birefringence-like 39 [Amaranthus tricolor]
MYTLSNVLFLLSLFLFLLVLQQTAEAERSLEHELTCRIPHKDTELTNNVTNSAIVVQSKCNIFQGKWVFDSSYPQYDSSNCPFIDLEFNCKSRPDKLYQKYKWQPFDCNLPRFNGEYFLNKWKGKKIMFVGDSLSLNQFESLGCMLHSWVPNTNTTYFRGGVLRSLTFEEFGVTLMLYRTPFLVDLMNKKEGRILNLDSISGNVWKGMDMLIFNSWHWWTHTGHDQPWDYIQTGNKLYRDMNRMVAYYKGLTTWARWVRLNVDPFKTKVFFLGISPSHEAGSDWNEPSKTCSSETEPFSGTKYPAGTPQARTIVEKVLSRIKNIVYWLDVTILSQYRMDAHPSIYSGRGRDCSHWCLPGLPDTWNQLLYAALF